MAVVDVVKKTYVDAQDKKLGFPIVIDNADRAAQYPVPVLNQRVHNRSSGNIEIYNGAAWLTEFEGTGGGITRYNTKAVGLTGNSVADDFAKLNTLANVTMQPNGGEIDVVGVPRIGSNLALPKNVKLHFRSGAYLAPDLGVTITVNAQLSYTLDKIFGGGGAVVFGTGSRVREVYPQWWGAVGDNVVDDYAPSQAAATAALPGSILRFVTPSVKYRFTNEVTIAKALTILGPGLGCEIVQVTVLKNIFKVTASSVEIAGFNLTGGIATTQDRLGSVVRILGAVGARLADVSVHHCKISNGNYGVLAQFVDGLDVFRNIILNCFYGGVFGESCSTVDVVRNKILNIFGNPNAYGISATRTAGGADPVSSDWLIFGNTIDGVPWEAIDCHGGIDIIALKNRIKNCVFGVAFGSDTDNNAPIRCAIQFNRILSGTAAATSVSGAHISGNAVNRAQDCEIIGNYIQDYGGGAVGSATGAACYMSYSDRTEIHKNRLRNSSQAAIKVLNACLDLSITNNRILGIVVAGPFICAIGLPDAVASTGVISGNRASCDPVAGIRAAQKQNIHEFDNLIQTTGLHLHLDPSYFLHRVPIRPAYINVNQNVNLTPDCDQYETYTFVMTANINTGAPLGRYQEGSKIKLRMKQDGVGGRTMGFNAIFKIGGFVPNIGAGKENTIDFEFDGVSFVATSYSVNL